MSSNHPLHSRQTPATAAALPPPPPSTAAAAAAAARKWAPGRMGRSRSTENVSLVGGGGGSPDSSPNPSIGGTPPTGTPPKKIWERHYRSFLTRRHQQQQQTATNRGDPSLLSSTSASSQQQPQPPLTTAPITNNSLLTPQLHPKFTLVPGSKRLLQRVQQDEDHHQIQQPVLSQLSALTVTTGSSTPTTDSTTMPSVPFLMQPQFNQAQQPPSIPHPLPLQQQQRVQSDDVSVKGGNLFQSLFQKSPTSSSSLQQQQNQQQQQQQQQHPYQLQQQQPHRKTKSMDELDGSKRMGHDKGNYNSAASPSQIRHSLTLSPRLMRKPPPPPTINLAAVTTTTTRPTLSLSSSSSQSATRAAATTSLSASIPQHYQSRELIPLPPPTLLSSLSASAPAPYQGQATSARPATAALHRPWGIVTEEDDDEDDEEEDENLSLRSDGVMVGSLTLPPPPPSLSSKSGSSSSSLAMLLSQRQHQKQQQQPSNSSSGLILPPPVAQEQQQQQQQQPSLPPPSSSPNTSAREMKKAFTEFHNSAMYAQDSTSAFLGDEPSTRQGTVFLTLLQQQQQQQSQQHQSQVTPQQDNEEGASMATTTSSMTASAASTLNPNMAMYNSASSDFYLENSSRARSNTASSVHLYSAASSYPLETVEEHVTIHRTMRMLKPIQSPDTWHEGRRYLIAPAALATCPLQVLSTISSPIAASLTPGAAVKEWLQYDALDETATETTTTNAKPSLSPNETNTTTTSSSIPKSNEWLAFCGSICLGEAAISYVIGDGTANKSASSINNSGNNSGINNVSSSNIASRKHLQLGKWTSCWLVLRQNYLLEFDVEQKHGMPRGYAHLQYAACYLHADFADSVVLEFFPSPCAQADKRVLMIKVANREEREHWVTCLNAAAQLKITDLYDYDASVEFGRGRYAAVYPARRRGKRQGLNKSSRLTQTNKLSLNGLDRVAILKECDCAIKIIDKNEFWKRVVKGKERADTLVREVTTQATLTAKCGALIPTFVRLRGFFETANDIVLELELLEGYDLFKYVSSKGVLDENEAASITRDILTSLESMHRVGLSHRDIKPANILMCNRAKHGAHVKVGDFGMATFIGVDGLVRGRCGTPGYVAPEIFNAMKRGGYSGNADVFSTGVTLYVMLCGYEPFYGESDDELVAANREAYLEFPESDWSSVSADARDLVTKMMEPDPKKRISAKDALNHRWIVNRHQNLETTPAATSYELEKVHCCIS